MPNPPESRPHPQTPLITRINTNTAIPPPPPPETPRNAETQHISPHRGSAKCSAYNTPTFPSPRSSSTSPDTDTRGCLLHNHSTIRIRTARVPNFKQCPTRRSFFATNTANPSTSPTSLNPTTSPRNTVLTTTLNNSHTLHTSVTSRNISYICTR